MKEKILVSACLTGINCKYDGKNNLKESLLNDLKNYEIVLICPEVDGGLSTPRVPSEVIGDEVINKEGLNVTENFHNGGLKALDLAIKYNIKYAILKAKSPSCGCGKIYDGTFTNTLIDGDGITSRMLKTVGVEIYNENNYHELLKGDK